MILKILVVFSHLLNRVPHRVRVALGAGIGAFWFHVLRFRRDVVLDNLRIAYGREKSESEIRRLAAANFRHYGLTLIEILLSITWSKADYEKNVPCHGIEHMRDAIAQGNGVYGLTCHLGNWEWVIGAVMSRGIPGDVVVKHSKNAALDAFLLRYRQNMGIGVFFESGTAKDILRSLSKGKLVGFILDQFMGPPIGLPVHFFGKQAGTAVGLALITDKKEAPIVPIYSYRDANDRLITVCEPAVQLPPFSPDRETRYYEKTQFFNDLLEERIRRHPDQWLWLHRRWKPFRGEPRWKRLAPAMVTSLCLFLAGCASQFASMDTPTGIELPAEPTVSIPGVVEEPKPATPPAEEPAKAVGKKAAPLPVLAPAPAKPAPVRLRTYTPEQIPFEIGERMTISLDWSALHAGTVQMEVREGLGFKGRSTFKLWGNVKSSPVVDAIYHIDNTIESYIDKEWLVPYKFLLHMVETHQLKETRAAFDHTKNQVHYWSKRISKKWGDDTQDRVDSAAFGSRDMYSALYQARVLNYKLGVAQEIPVYENRENLVATLTPVANEFVQTKAGAFQCWKVSMTLKLNNVLKPNGDLFLWLSDDSKKYIVKFDAKLKLGSLRGELINVRERR